MTDRYAVIGNPILHSKSPRIHSLFAAQTGQDMSYEALQAPRDGFVASITEFARQGGRGASVTVPFKEEAFRLADRLTPRAKAAGAVNTLSFTAGEILGDNTDGAGLVNDIEINLNVRLNTRRILLLGAGGAARGVILPLLLAGPSELLIANRTADKATGLVQEFSRLPGGALKLQPSACRFAELAGRQFDIVINATSAGLENAALPIPVEIYAPGALAYEMLYGRETPFMSQARLAGARVVDGLGMLVGQAAEAFELWRGVRPDCAPILQFLRDA